MTDPIRAEFEVRQFQARYMDAVFRKDYAAFADCFTEDAEWRIAGRVVKGREDITAFLKMATANFHRVIMTFRTPIVRAVEDELQARTYVTEQNAPISGVPTSTIGTYFERLVENGGVWRRKWALFQLHYKGPVDLAGPFFEEPDFGAPPNFPPVDAPTFHHAGAEG